MKNLLLLLAAIPLMYACVKEVHPDFKNYEKDVVVNSLLVPDSFMTVRLSESLRSDKEEIFPSISDAEVEISDGKTKMKLLPAGNGLYNSKINPLPDVGYSLKIVSHDGKILNATTKIPSLPQISIIPLVEEKMVQVTITDNPGEENFYWIGKKGYSFSSRMTYYWFYLPSDFILFDDFNKTRNDEFEKRTDYQYHFYARLEDKQFNGKSVSFSFPHYWHNSSEMENLNYREYIYIINADKHLDQYMKTALLQYELRIFGDAPIFQTPIDMYSNITNGKGIFGSYTISQFDITVP